MVIGEHIWRIAYGFIRIRYHWRESCQELLEQIQKTKICGRD